MRAFLYQNHPLFLLLVHGIKYINNKSKHKYLQIIIKTICHHQFLLFFMDVFSHFIFHFHYFQHINKSFCSYNSSFLIFFLSPVCFQIKSTCNRMCTLYTSGTTGVTTLFNGKHKNTGYINIKQTNKSKLFFKLIR